MSITKKIVGINIRESPSDQSVFSWTPVKHHQPREEVLSRNAEFDPDNKRPGNRRLGTL